MTSDLDIRWKQRFENFTRALTRLGDGLRIINANLNVTSEVDEMLKEGLVQRFEYTQELAWKVLKDYAEYQGYTDVMGSRDAIRLGLEMGVISDRAWMNTIAARNVSSHCYDDAEFIKILNDIETCYYPLFEALKQKMDTLM